MKPETAMYVEEAYQNARAETWDGYTVASLEPISDEAIEGIRVTREAVLETGWQFKQDREVGTEERQPMSDDVKEKMGKYLLAQTGSVIHKRSVEEDLATREIVKDTVSGLTAVDSLITPSLMVRFNSVWQLGGKNVGGEDRSPINAIEAVPSFVALHPETNRKETGIYFATRTSWLISRMLTPDLVEIVLADETREKPTIVSDFDKRIGLIESSATSG